MGFGSIWIQNDFVRLPPGSDLRGAKVGALEAAHFITYSKRVRVSLVRQDEFKTVLKQAVSEGKRIQLGYPSDYRSKSIEEADRRQLMNAQLNMNFRIPSKFPVSGESRQRSASYRKRKWKAALRGACLQTQVVTVCC